MYANELALESSVQGGGGGGCCHEVTPIPGGNVSHSLHAVTRLKFTKAVRIAVVFNSHVFFSQTAARIMDNPESQWRVGPQWLQVRG